VRKAADVILILLILGGIGVGAYAIGRAVTHESNEGGARSADTTPRSVTTTTVTTPSKPRDLRDLQILVAKIVAGGVAALLIIWAVKALFRSSRRARWRT